MPNLNKFASHAVLADKESKRVFYKLYINDIGCFWDMQSRRDPLNHYHRSNNNNLYRDLFPEATKIIRSKKVQDHFTLPTNYVFAISERITQSVFGTGVNITMDPPNDEYTEWYKERDLNLIIATQLKEALAVGSAGIRFGFSDGKLQPLPFSYDNYFPKKDLSYFVYQIETDHDKELKTHGKRLVYVVTIQRQDDGTYRQQHNVFEVPETDPLDFGNERRKIFDKLFPEADVDSKGFEPFIYPEKPYVLLNSGRFKNLIPESIFADSLPQIQTLWVYDTMTFLEIQINYGSKMALDESMMLLDPSTNTRKNLGTLAYIPLDANNPGSIKPEYIQKHMAEPYEVLKDHRKKMENDIAVATGIPIRIISPASDQKQDAVGVTELDFQAYDNKVKALQQQVERVVREIQTLWFSIEAIGREVPTITFKFQSVFPKTLEEREFILDMFSAGLLSKEDALKDILIDETEEQIILRIERLAKEREKATAAVQATTTATDLTNLL